MPAKFDRLLEGQPQRAGVALGFLGFYWLIMGVLALVRVFVDRSTPWIFFTCTAFANTNLKSPSSKMCHTGFQ
jgi:hypothetical protein